jgi:glycerol uptake operon antiterminator
MDLTKKIIAAVRDDDDFEEALTTGVDTIFFLSPDIMELEYIAKKAHEKKKTLFLHIDLTLGLGKDQSGIEYARNAGIDGIISTRANLIKAARECGMKTVQRFFAVDSQSINTTVETLKSSKADMVEVMPGLVPKVIEKLKTRIAIPIIAGGLIETKEEVATVLKSGCFAVSTGAKNLWNE